MRWFPRSARRQIALESSCSLIERHDFNTMANRIALLTRIDKYSARWLQIGTSLMEALFDFGGGAALHFNRPEAIARDRK